MAMKIFITRPVPPLAIALLKKAGHSVARNTNNVELSRTELRRRVKGAHAILSLLTTRIDGPVMDAAGPQLSVIANYAVGYDNIDLDAAKKRGIAVTNTPAHEVSLAVADHTVALIASLSRRIVEADTFVRKGAYRIWDPNIFIGTSLSGRMLGLVGLGRIGKEVARRMIGGFGMTVAYHDVNRDRGFEKECGARYLPLASLLSRSDVVSLHVPLLPTTRHLIGARELRMMRKGSLLINTARGPVVDTQALFTALQKKRIGGAALDVFECEPAIACSASVARECARLPNVIFTPHIGSATTDARDAMSRIAAENILAVLSGKKPQNSAF